MTTTETMTAACAHRRTCATTANTQRNEPADEPFTTTPPKATPLSSTTDGLASYDLAAARRFCRRNRKAETLANRL
jgi:hypothetical protein